MGQSLYRRKARIIFKSQNLYEEEGSEFLQVPESVWRGRLEQWHLAPRFARIFANEEVEAQKRKLGFLSSPRAYIEGERSEFFLVSESIWRRQLEQWQLALRFAQIFTIRLYLKEGEARKFFKSKGLYRGTEIGIFPSPRTYMDETVGGATPLISLRSVIRQLAVF